MTQTRGDATTGGTSDKSTKAADKPKRKGVFARLIRFFREVVNELSKVIRPTRKELVTYTVVVVVFVSFMVALVAGLDILFAKAVLAVFG